MPVGDAPGGGRRASQIDAEQVLSDAEEIAMAERDLAAYGDVGTVRGAEIGRRERGGGAIETHRNVAPRHERVVGEDDVPRLAPNDGFVPVQVKHVSGHPLDRALTETTVTRKHGQSEEQRPVLRRRAKPLLRVFHGLKP